MNSRQVKEIMYSLGADLYIIEACGAGGRTGNMIWLGAVLCDEELEPDEIKENICNNCNLCVDICPYNLGSKNSFIKRRSIPE